MLQNKLSDCCQYETYLDKSEWKYICKSCGAFKHLNRDEIDQVKYEEWVTRIKNDRNPNQ